jgi:hypothetical protein
MHALWQCEPAQVDVPLTGAAGQAFPHAPQWLMSVVVSTHALPHVVGAVLGQVVTHAEATQLATPFVSVDVQAVPHAPQWLTSLAVSTHVSPHFVGALLGQLDAHACLSP